MTTAFSKLPCKSNGRSAIQQLTTTFLCPSAGGKPSCNDRGLGSPSASTFAHATASPNWGEMVSPR